MKLARFAPLLAVAFAIAACPAAPARAQSAEPGSSATARSPSDRPATAERGRPLPSSATTHDHDPGDQGDPGDAARRAGGSPHNPEEAARWRGLEAEIGRLHDEMDALRRERDQREAHGREAAAATGAHARALDIEVGFLAGAAVPPFRFEDALFAGGFLDVALLPSPPGTFGRFSAELSVQWLGDSGNLGASFDAAGNQLATGDARLDQLSLGLALRYRMAPFDGIPVLENARPYVTSGLGFHVQFATPDDLPPGATGEASNLPAGDAEVELGILFGFGVDLRITERLSLAPDLRYHLVNDHATDFFTYGIAVRLQL